MLPWLRFGSSYLCRMTEWPPDTGGSCDCTEQIVTVTGQAVVFRLEEYTQS